MSDSDDKVTESKLTSEETTDSKLISLTTNLENVQIEVENPETKKQVDTEKPSTPVSEPAIPSKIEILLKAAGNAPILKKKKFLLDRTKNVHYIVDWLKKYMKLEPKDQLFVYVNQEFAPSPDAEIGTIYDCFKTGNNVILHYCTTPAWG